MNVDRLRVAVQQFAPRLLDVAGNAERIAHAATEADADLVVTPELALTGYQVGDEAASVARPAAPGDESPVPLPAGAPDLVVGLVERGTGARVYNAAVHQRDGRILAAHRKVYLPTYGMFDEGRVFASGDRVRAYDAGGGWTVGLLVCEDLWHPSLAYLLAVQDVRLLVVLAAAPGRGVWDGGEGGGRFASADAWHRIVRATAQLYGIYVVLANRIGVEDGLTFAGGSRIVAPDGAVLAAAPAADEAVIGADLSLEALASARRPYDHSRDEDPHLTLRELRRAIERSERGDG